MFMVQVEGATYDRLHLPMKITQIENQGHPEIWPSACEGPSLIEAQNWLNSNEVPSLCSG